MKVKRTLYLGIWTTGSVIFLGRTVSVLIISQGFSICTGFYCWIASYLNSIAVFTLKDFVGHFILICLHAVRCCCLSEIVVGFWAQDPGHGGKFPHRPTAVFPLCPQLGTSHVPTVLSDPCPAELLLANRGAVMECNWLHQLRGRRHTSAGYGDVLLRVCVSVCVWWK